MHKIGDSWYLVATAGLNTGNGTTFNIRPFMIKFEGNPKKESMLDADKWGKPELVKPVSGDNVLNAMSLDMTYFEADGKHYLIWADETKNSQNPDGLSYLFIARIDPENPTQLTSKAKLLTKPEFAWELVRYKVNEGPGVFKKDGKVYMTFEDEGIPYNPLEKKDPDVTLSVEEREIGGLGIYMVKKSMDEITYENKDGKNILTLMKKL